MSSRDKILNALRAKPIASTELPDLAHAWIRYDDPWTQFQTVLASVGGRFVRVQSLAEIPATLAELPTFADATQIVSQISAVTGNVDLDSIADPHELETVDWAILPAEFAVAENAALWVTDAALRQRVIYFLVQHLALVVSSDQIVHNLHEAYARLAVGASSLGLFMSGPSKTADIEQSLVIGAHGPRSLTVFCVDADR
jgi:L-lactate dehydrogenase complex protein LldG